MTVTFKLAYRYSVKRAIKDQLSQKLLSGHTRPCHLFFSVLFPRLLYFFVFICVYALYFLCYHELVNKDLYKGVQ